MEASRTNVFICYSRKDERWRSRLETHLKPLARNLDIDVWSDRRLEAGQKWREKIREAIERADIAVLIVSPDFLASDFINTHELPPLLEQAALRGTTVLPIVASPCLFTETTTLEGFHAINDPDEPLVEMSEGAQERTFVRVAKAVMNAKKARRVLEREERVNATPPPSPRSGENFLDPLIWAGLLKVGNWIYDESRRTIVGAGMRSFLLSQREYGDIPFSICATVAFTNFNAPDGNKPGMNAGIVVGWRNEKELVVPYYYNFLLTGREILLELNGPYTERGARWQHLTEPVPLVVTPGVPMEFEITVAQQRVSVAAGGRVLMEPKRPEGMIGRVGLRPWRAQVECTQFRILTSY